MSELRSLAVAAEVRFTGLLNRGPTQSRQVWEAQLVELDAQCRTAWAAWADEVFTGA